MKKFKLNNFIAFTLSEMMIVLLIFSVLSAAMLPSIIGKKKKTMPLDDTPVTRWQGENQTFGTYYQNGNTKVFLGGNPIDLSTYSPTLILNRNISNTLCNINFYQNSQDVGKIISDSSKNIGIGKDIKLSGSYNLFLGNYVAKMGYYRWSVLMGTYAGASADKYNEIQSMSDYNIGIGYYAGARKSYKDYDTSIGYYAGYTYNETSLYRNVNIGFYAGYYNKLSDNVCIGTDSCLEAKDGNVTNVAIGYNAGKSSSDSVSIGDNVGYLSSRMVSIGNMTGYMSSADSVAIGDWAGFYNSGYDMDSRLNNVFIGTYAGKNSLKAQYNTFIGYESGHESSNASYNTSIGMTTGYAFSGSYSTFIGSMAGWSAKGSYNTFIGTSAGRESNGSYNTFIGTNVGPNSTGNYSTAVGDGCRAIAFKNNKTCISPWSGEVLNTNQQGIGAWEPKQSSHSADIIIAMGSSASDNRNVITLYAAKVYAGSSTITAFSDKRLKENIKPVKNSLEKIRKINIYEYSMKSDKTHEPKIGVLAQELKNIIPEAVSVHPKSKYYTVSADWIMFTAIDAIKDLDKMVQNLQNDVKNYIKQLLDVSKIVENLDIRLNNIAETHVVMQAKLKEIDKILSKTENK